MLCCRGGSHVALFALFELSSVLFVLDMIRLRVLSCFLSLPSYLHITMLYSCYCLPDSHVVQVLRNTTDGVLFWCCSSSPRGVRLCMGRPARARLCSVFSVLFVLCSPRARPVCALLSPGPSRLCSLCCPVRARPAFFVRLVFVFVANGALYVVEVSN